MSAVATIKTRADFLAVRGGRRASTPSFLIEMRPTPAGAASPAVSPPKAETARFGFTITKKLGNAVTRNRIRRRLKAAVSAVSPIHACPGHDYVIVARRAAFDRPYASLISDLERALTTLHPQRDRESSAKKGRT
jgi:ribonuclease P protein component